MDLDKLELTEEARRAAREEIQRMAYFVWERAGRPDADPLEFWREAERDWICFCYVPDRALRENEPVSPAGVEQLRHEPLAPVATRSRS